MGGATAVCFPRMTTRADCFNRRGDSLGGATPIFRLHCFSPYSVSIAEAILWGEQRAALAYRSIQMIVSIAEAILWGEQRKTGCYSNHGDLFQSQRRFFGGSNGVRLLGIAPNDVVSIAEAILWGEQRGKLSTYSRTITSFNRRGDSLGGATRQTTGYCMRYRSFQSQRRFFGGSNGVASLGLHRAIGFNRRGDSLGGATTHRANVLHRKPEVSIAEAILWGEQRYEWFCPPCDHVVSIAEAILWGEQLSWD